MKSEFWGDSIFQRYIWIFWDAVAVVIFFMCVKRCVRKGFISTVMGFFVYIAATAAAMSLSGRLAQLAYDNFVYDAVLHSLTRSLNAMLTKPGGSPKNIMDAVPAGLRFMIGENSGEIAQLPLDAAETLSESIISLALRDPITSALHAVGFLMIFTVAALIMRFFTRLFTGINNIPVIGPINTFFGGVIGILEGGLSLYFSAVLLRLIIAFSGGVWWQLNSQVMASTYIWRHFYS